MERALLLFQQSRFELAERELRQELSTDPNNPLAHALLALCLLEAKRYKEATDEVETAIGLAPDLDFAHYVRARVLLGRERLKEAKAAIDEAIRLDPSDADYFATVGDIHIAQRDWKAALAAAEEGLRNDPEHVPCTNIRAAALVNLGRREEAGTSIESALAKEPENAFTHANQGWALLHRAQYESAQEHFREALRLDPQLEWARKGMVEALKGSHFLYGLMLRYFLWMSTLTPRTQFFVLLGGLLAYRALRGAARSMPDLGPWITPLLVAYGLFVLMTWLAGPLFNLILRFNRFGRLTLNAEETLASNLVGACLGVALVLGFASFPMQQSALLGGALFFGLLALPVSGTFMCSIGWPRNVMTVYTGLLTLLGIAGIGLLMVMPRAEVTVIVLGVGIAGVVIGTWLARGLSVVTVKR